MIEPCRCKGTVRYVHPECLIKWLAHPNSAATSAADSESGENDDALSRGAGQEMQKRCPQCRYAYRIVEKHETILSRIVDSTYFTTLTTCIVIACCYVVFHMLFTRTMSRICGAQRSRASQATQRGGGILGGFMRVSTLTNIFTEIEIFCGCLGVMYYIYRMIHVMLWNTIPDDHVIAIAEANWNEFMQNASADVYSFPIVLFLVFYKTCRQIIDNKKNKLIRKRTHVLQYHEPQAEF